jgi:hypothetical protein
MSKIGTGGKPRGIRLVFGRSLIVLGLILFPAIQFTMLVTGNWGFFKTLADFIMSCGFVILGFAILQFSGWTLIVGIIAIWIGLGSAINSRVFHTGPDKPPVAD